MNEYLKRVGLLLCMADLSELPSTKTELVDVPLLFDEDGEPSAGFKVVTSDHDDYQRIDRQYRIQGVKKSARRGRGIDAKTDEGATELMSVLDKREMAILLGCIKKVYGFTDGPLLKDGEPVMTEKLKKTEDGSMGVVVDPDTGIAVLVPAQKPAELNEATLSRIFKARPTWKGKTMAAIETDQVFIKAS